MKQWNDKRYHSLNYELREQFGKKMVKLSLDGGFTCPNRDGTLSTKGCIFCSERGSGDFAGKRTASVKEQIDQQIALLEDKWPEAGYLAYLQNYTNTYGTIEHLQALYHEILSQPHVKGLAIATRADCLDENILNLLEDLSHKHFIWVELGVQSIHEKSREWMNRQESLEETLAVLKALQARGIRVVAHLILGLPGETREDMLLSVKQIGALVPWGIKLHLLHIIAKTPLDQWYQSQPFDMMERGAYVELLADALEVLPPQTTIHRLTGDAPRKQLVAPLWAVRKRLILNELDRLLKKRNSWQGMKWKGADPSWVFNG